MSWLFQNDRKRFLSLAGSLKEFVKTDLSYEYQQFDQLPTPERCKQAARWLEAECERKGVKATANIRASGRRVVFVIKDKNGKPMYEGGTSIVLKKMDELNAMEAYPKPVEPLTSTTTASS